MLANELRIGNWIKDTNDNGDFYQVDEIYKDCFNAGPMMVFPAGMMFDYGIPLTEEWLLKFGFELNGYASKKLDVIVYDFKGFRLKKFNGRMSKFFIEWGTGTRTYIAYVHKLQNVFYELNCEELEPKKA